MELLELIIEYHKDNERQGPGSEEATLKALSYIPYLNENTKILDIGCGSGGQTIALAKNTAAHITAVDMFPQFLEMLMKKSKENNLINRIVAEEMLMESLTFKENSFDVIWSEGAIYNIGFEKGLSLWRKYLKDNGYIAVSEISWLTDTRPDEIEQYWVNAYSEIDTIENKLAVIEKCGYAIVSHFALDDKCWLDYYQPLLENAEAFLKRYDYADEVKEIIEAGKIEADLYNRFKDYYSYVFYIAKKKSRSMPTTDEELQRNTVGELKPHNAPITLAEYDPIWPELFEREANQIRSILGSKALQVEHVGSTSVLGLCAKPIIDILLVVEDSADEPSYVPALEAAGYTLRIRESDWFEHRLFKGPDTDINLHVFSLGTSEIERMLRFRDWLRSNETDREKYAQVKRSLAENKWRHVQHYANAKTSIVQEIMERANGNNT